jgi:ribosomal protein S1
MPGSLGGVNKLVNFEELLGEDIYVCAINYSKEKDYIVVSHRDYLRALIPQALDAIDPGDSFGGFITGTTKFGVFVEFNKCLTGLIHKSDLDDETLEKFNSRELKPGDEVDFTVKELASNNRIILTQKEFIPVIDPWDDVLEKYSIPSEVTGKIRKKTKYGLFIELEPKIVGLLHISDIPDYVDVEDMHEGDNITLNLIKIEPEEKKVFFKI